MKKKKISFGFILIQFTFLCCTEDKVTDISSYFGNGVLYNCASGNYTLNSANARIELWIRSSDCFHKLFFNCLNTDSIPANQHTVSNSNFSNFDVKYLEYVDRTLAKELYCECDSALTFPHGFPDAEVWNSNSGVIDVYRSVNDTSNGVISCTVSVDIRNVRMTCGNYSTGGNDVIVNNINFPKTVMSWKL